MAGELSARLCLLRGTVSQFRAANRRPEVYKLRTSFFTKYVFTISLHFRNTQVFEAGE